MGPARENFVICHLAVQNLKNRPKLGGEGNHFLRLFWTKYLCFQPRLSTEKWNSNKIEKLIVNSCVWFNCSHFGNGARILIWQLLCWGIDNLDTGLLTISRASVKRGLIFGIGYSYIFVGSSATWKRLTSGTFGCQSPKFG